MKRLLLVDDDADVLEALSLVLSDHFVVTPAADGTEALRLLRDEPFDVVLLDVMMPVLDGAAVLDVLRRGGNRVPVLLGSALPDLQHLAGQLDAPWARKPYDVDRLVKSLKRLADPGVGGPAGAGPEESRQRSTPHQGSGSLARTTPRALGVPASPG